MKNMNLDEFKELLKSNELHELGALDWFICPCCSSFRLEKDQKFDVSGKELGELVELCVIDSNNECDET